MINEKYFVYQLASNVINLIYGGNLDRSINSVTTVQVVQASIYLSTRKRVTTNRDIFDIFFIVGQSVL